MAADLSTTNLFLGLIALSSLIEMLAIGLLCVGLFMVATRVKHLIRTVETQHLPPAADRVRGILDDVKDVTSTVRAQADRIDGLASWMFSAMRFWRGGK
jgi:hypothetical protein